MSERMNDETAEEAWKNYPCLGDGSEWAEPVAAEFWRARSEEARLLKENAEKDATIKALADALEEVFRRGLGADDVYERTRTILVQHGRVAP